MKTKARVIISLAAAAAISLGIVATATADTMAGSDIITADGVEESNQAASPVEETEQASAEEINKLLDEEIVQLPAEVQSVCSEQAYTSFEQNQLEGRFAYDFNGSLYELSDLNGTPRDVSVQSSVNVSLTKVQDISKGYNLWEGRFTTDSVAAFSESFTQPEYFNCTIGMNPSMSTAKAPGMSGNYKTVKAVYTYLEYVNDVPCYVSYPYEKSDNTQTVSLSAPNTSYWTLVEAVYYFYLYAGTGSSAPIYEEAVVHVVNSSYAQSAAYAQNSYANLIESYTYVDTSDFVDA